MDGRGNFHASLAVWIDAALVAGTLGVWFCLHQTLDRDSVGPPQMANAEIFKER